MSRVKSAVILAGGLGTRLRSAVNDLPKCLAPIAGRPFIDYVIEYALNQGLEKLVFALGYKASDIINHLETSYPHLNYCFTIETQPLGTGGGILLASEKVEEDRFFVLNGDTLFLADLRAMEKLHQVQDDDVTLALKLMTNFDRYGSVILDNNKITSFNEKQFTTKGYINGGIYLIQKQILDSYEPGDVFSFEKDILEPLSHSQKIGAMTFSRYFIDIGIPEDYHKANIDLTNFNLSELE